jgi:hypothetical protein
MQSNQYIQSGAGHDKSSDFLFFVIRCMHRGALEDISLHALTDSLSRKLLHLLPQPVQAVTVRPAGCINSLANRYVGIS